jgi:hypothetical protein
MNSTTLPFTVALPEDVPFAFNVQALTAHLQHVPDRRDPRGVRYPLAPLLTLAVLAKIAGYSRLEAVADWATRRAADLATPMAQQEMASPGGAVYRSMIETSASRRIGTPDDVASAAAFLLGPDSSFVTGTDLLIDGGVIAALRSGRLKLPPV